MRIPLLDLKAQYRQIREEVMSAVQAVFDSQQFILGRTVEELECRIAEYCGTSSAVGVSSGTDALLICLMAEGIGPGDEVVTTPFTFFATAGSIARTGARPVFVDIEENSFNINPDLLPEAVSGNTRAVIAVHLFGRMCEVEEIRGLCTERGLILIEDAAQAIGAESGGRRAGSVGEYGCLSFFPTKNLGGAGDGGMVLTSDARRADLLRSLRNHGAVQRYFHEKVGGNFRLDAVQAAVLGVKLKYLDRWIEMRRANADRYARLFRESGLVDAGLVSLPDPGTGRHVFHQYVIRAHHRDALREYLREKGVGCEIYYPVPLHLQKCFRHLGYRRGDFPVSEKAAAEVLALPMYPELTDEQAEYVVAAVRDFYG